MRVTPASRFVVQGNPAGATVDARYYFGQPVAAGRVRNVVHRQPYYSSLRWSAEDENGEGGWWYAGDQIVEGEARLADDGTVRIEVPTAADDQLRDYSLRIEARVADAAGREVSGSGRAGIDASGRMVQDTAYVWIPGPSSRHADETGDRYLELIAVAAAMRRETPRACSCAASRSTNPS